MIEPVGHWGRRPYYSAKVGTGPGTLILVKRARKFSVGQRIDFCDTSVVRGMSTGCTPKWDGGKIWKIEHNRLFVELL